MQTRGEARQDEILGVVAELIAEVGWDGLTTDAVVARAQTSKTTLYRHWPGGRIDLVTAALRRAADCAPVAVGDAGGVVGDLRACLDSMVDVLVGVHGIALIELLNAARRDDELRAQMRRLFDASCQENAAAVTRNAAARGVRLDERLVGRALEVAFAWAMSQIVFDAVPPDAEARQEFAEHTLLRLIESTP
ncbi:TetR/AcrR family transcriptional regulator [Lentzea albida]|uniref:Transcriptional regulator, TetR family n=1 Tax=Lentzea albida TaxID=65499 RepID=A0A1H9V9B9_9PSEU|nr:TetR/AcrR family transcriptional regulator [Lentzea albida]SES17817.1 transcriptional regulator, TetR family [Lentzea albida]